MKTIVGTYDQDGEQFGIFDLPIDMVTNKNGYYQKRGKFLYRRLREWDDAEDYQMVIKECECCGHKKYYAKTLRFKILGRNAHSFSYRVMRLTRNTK